MAKTQAKAKPQAEPVPVIMALQLNEKEMMRGKVIEYLEDQLAIARETLAFYRPNLFEDEKRDVETKRLREVQAMVITEKISDIARHISVIKRIRIDG